jgi:hypothetical protein
LIDVAFTGGPVTAKTGLAATGLTANDFWNSFTELDGAVPGLQFVDGTLSGAGIIVTGANGAYADSAADPMIAAYLYDSVGDITITVTNLIPSVYSFYLYGQGNMDDENGVFQITVGSQNYGPTASLLWGPGALLLGSEFDNVKVLAGEAVTITVVPGNSSIAVISGLQIKSVSPPLIVTQPTNQIAIQGLNANLSPVVIGTPPLVYQWRFNGTPIPGATNGTFTVTNAQSGSAGSYSVVVTNAYGALQSSNAILTVTTVATIGTQPASQIVFLGSNATFNVAAGGAPPVDYQWLFNGVKIPGATNSSYIITNVQPSAAGGYSVLITNGYGITTSAVATLSAIPRPATLIDVAIASFPTTKTGFAATGLSSNDFWNSCVIVVFSGANAILTNLESVDGALSGVGLELDGNIRSGGNQSSDPMYSNCLFSYQDMIMTITNLAPGFYDLYLYGHGDQDNINSVFQVSEGSQILGLEATTNGPGWLSPVWQEGAQYVVFTNVSVAPEQSLSITVEPGAGGVGLFSGLQIALVDPGVSGPFISVQPTNQATALGSSATFSISAKGTLPLGYQWWFSNSVILGATNSSFTVTNAQPGNAGDYSVVVTNAYGAAGSSNASLTVIYAPTILSQPAQEEILHGSNANFSVLAVGAPPLYYQWLFNGGAISGATNASYSIINAQPSASGGYSVLVTNADGAITSAVAALTVVPLPSTLIDVAFGRASPTAKTGFAATGISSNDFWNSCNSSNLANLAFVTGTSSGAGLQLIGATSSGGNPSSDPMYANCFFSSGDMTLTLTNLVPGFYNIYLYGHGALDYDNSVFQLSAGSQVFGGEATINGPGWLSPAWQEGVQFVVFTNVSIAPRESLVITVEPGAGGASGVALLSGLQIAAIDPGVSRPFISVQPAGQSAALGANVAFGASAEGSMPLAYQWLFNDFVIPGATNSSYILSNVQSSNVGFYSVIVTNYYGSVTSAAAVLNVAVPASTLIDVAFTGHPPTAKTGFAVTGVASNDFWNSTDFTNLNYVDGTPSGAVLSTSNSVDSYTNAVADPMYAAFINSLNGQDMTVTVTNLAPGTYNIYLYGHGPADNENSTFQVSVGLQVYGSQSTTTNSDWNLPIWEPGAQYVEFTNVGVRLDQPLVITVEAGYLYAIICGLQLAQVGPPPSNPAVDTQQTNETIVLGSTAILRVGAEGVAPLAYQWLYDNNSITGATNETYSLTNAQLSDAGSYSVIVTNPFGSVTSTVATLTIIPLAIIAQPAEQHVAQGSTATLDVLAGGAKPLAYQWLFNNAAIPGATNNTCVVTNVQPANAGNYSVIVTNAYGSITSLVAMLNLMAGSTPAALIDVSFAGKTGYAATGISTNDFWNTDGLILVFPGYASGIFPNPKFVNGAASTAGINVGGVVGAYNNGASDPMYASYVYANEGDDLTVTITGLNMGVYDFFVYGHGDYAAQNSTYQITGGSPNSVSETTTTNSDWMSAIWQEGVQFVEFTNIIVYSGEPIIITVEPGASGWAVLSGLQIESVPFISASPFILVGTTNQQAPGGSIATFGIVAAGTAPFSYQWLFNGAIISEATNSSYSITNVQLAAAGYYSVIVTNAYGSITSAPAALDVTAAPVVLEPTVQVINPGSNATFILEAGGQPPYEYQWLFDGAAIAAATNSTYTVSNAQRANIGSYSIIVSNSFGVVTSGPGTLTLYENSGALMNVAFTGAPVTQKTGRAATGISSNDFWNTFSSAHISGFPPFGLSPIGPLIWADGTVSEVGLTLSTTDFPTTQANGAADPMYGTYMFSAFEAGGVTVELDNLSPGIYNFYLYGHGSANDLNTAFSLSVGFQGYGTFETTTGTNWLSPIWQEFVQYVEFTNVSVSAGWGVTIYANPGAGPYGVISGLQIEASNSQIQAPLVLALPADQAVVLGSNAVFNVLAEGAPPLEYQWLFENAPIPAATNSGYVVTNAQFANEGLYSVVVSNAYGSITTPQADLNVFVPPLTLIDIACTSASATGKSGPAATGIAASDFWNTYIVKTESLANLKFADGTPSGAGLTVTNDSAAYSDTVFDAMLSFYGYSTVNIVVTVTNLTAGTYDFYLYGHGNEGNQNSIFQMTVGPENYGPQATANGGDWVSPVWQEGVQYVEFTNVSVPNNQAVTITVEPGASGYAVLCGLQIANVGLPSIFAQPTNQAVVQGSTATWSVSAVGAMPLAYQWFFDNAAISGATNSALSATNAQLATAGSYSLVMSNQYGSITSAVTTLTVLTPFITGAARNADGSVTLTFVSPPNTPAQIWAATDLVAPIVWQPIFTNNNVGPAGQWQFTGTNAVNYPEMFYRISVP